MKYSILFAFVFALALISCEKEELPVAPHVPGTSHVSTVNMNADYRYQVYFDLETNSMAGQSLKSSWDLGFECTADGMHVILNSAKSMFAMNTHDTTFAAVTDTTGFAAGKRWDEPTGTLDSTAIGDWTVEDAVYIIDRGYNEAGQHQGFRKLKIENVNAQSFTVHFANLNGSGDVTMTIPKDSAFNFRFLSFANGGQLVTVEPPKHTWDIVFSQYTHVFHDPFQPYLVTGCLLNRHNTRACRDTLYTYNNITFSDLPAFPLSAAINVIGYDWKFFDGTSYVINPDINFIIEDQHGYFYKLHFLDFYDQNGIKGNPQWEYQRL
jgi:hypothetical protein